MGVSLVAVTHAWHTLQGFVNGTEAFDTVSLEHDVGSFDKGRGRASTVDIHEDVGRFHRQSIETIQQLLQQPQEVQNKRYEGGGVGGWLHLENHVGLLRLRPRKAWCMPRRSLSCLRGQQMARAARSNAQLRQSGLMGGVMGSLVAG